MSRDGAAPSLTAAQEILLGASNLDQQGKREFSEWDLTVATWKRNPNRFGCRGYEADYPDHKRVMMEIMGTTKKDNPIRRGWLEKVKPNTYRLTNIGMTESERLTRNSASERQSIRSPQAIYDEILPLYKSSVFRKHSRDPEEPRMWLGAASFLQLTKNDPLHLEDRLRATRAAIENALDWMSENHAEHIQRGVSGGGEAISKGNVLQIKAFFDMIVERFADQIEAVKRQRR
jgi:hypothetical protein